MYVSFGSTTLITSIHCRHWLDYTSVCWESSSHCCDEVTTSYSQFSTAAFPSLVAGIFSKKIFNISFLTYKTFCEKQHILLLPMLASSLPSHSLRSRWGITIVSQGEDPRWQAVVLVVAHWYAGLHLQHILLCQMQFVVNCGPVSNYCLK